MILTAFDIETTGLYPTVDRVIAAGFCNEYGDEVAIRHIREDVLLARIQAHVAANPCTLVSWNGEEFDFPFLAHRFQVHGLTSRLWLKPRHALGKYGNPLFEASWAGSPHVDIAPLWEHFALTAGIKHSLKPVARHLDLNPIEVDRTRMPELTADELDAYVLSDVRVTVAMAQMAGVTPKESK